MLQSIRDALLVRRRLEALSDRALMREVRDLLAQRADTPENAPAVPVSEAAALLGCERSTVFDYLKRGRLTRSRSIGKKTLVTRASIDALLATPELPPSASKPPKASISGARERDKVLNLVRGRAKKTA